MRRLAMTLLILLAVVLLPVVVLFGEELLVVVVVYSVIFGKALTGDVFGRNVAEANPQEALVTFSDIVPLLGIGVTLAVVVFFLSRWTDYLNIEVPRWKPQRVKLPHLEYERNKASQIGQSVQEGSS